VNGDEIWVDCPGLTNVRLGLDPFYENLYQRIRRVRGVSLGKEEKHVTDFVDRAKLITYAIDLRGQTLHRIADHVVHYQRDLVLHGLRFVKPYTQKQVAEVLGVHESTVCRATAGKLVQLPNGETVTFDVFFDDAAPVRDLVADIIGHEDKRTPLKDGQVAEELERRGVKIARRTVAKYRDQLKILACEMRKER
jgi:RNA polymerase sigma-54 factor